jgi:hypothetical protein
VPLREELQGIGRRIIDFLERGGDDPPFTVYQYAPEQEWQVRADLHDLQRWLAGPGRNVSCAALSLSQLFWTALDESGFTNDVITQEVAASGDPAALAEVYESVGEVLRHPKTLPDRVIEEVDAHDDKSVVFLYQAGVLYPAYRTSTLLDDLRGRLHRPVTLLYPGRLIGDYGLSFMDRTEPSYGYRALIIPREPQS